MAQDSSLQLDAAGMAMLLDNAIASIYIVDKYSYEVLYANRPALERWGRSDYRGHACHAFVSGLAEPCPWCSIPHMEGGHAHVDEVFSDALGKWFRIDCHDIRWMDRDAIAVFAVDITSQKDRQISAEIDRDSLRTIVGNIPIGIGVSQIRDGVGRPIASNRFICELLGVTEEEFSTADTTIFQRVHEADRERIKRTMARFSVAGAHERCSFRYRRPGDPSWRWYLLETRTVEQPDGVLVVFSCISDMTTEHEAELGLWKNRQMYESAIETAGLIVWEYDRAAHRITMSDNLTTRAFCREYGIDRVTEDVPESIIPLADERSAEALRAMYRALDEGQTSASCEIWYRPGPGGKPRCGAISYTAVFDDEGDLLTLLGIDQDVTKERLERQRYERLYRQMAKVNPRSISTFQMNLTRNWCGNGQSLSAAVLERQREGTADGYIESFLQGISDPHRREELRAVITRESLIEAFEEGSTSISFEYPVRDAQGASRWIQGLVNMARNPDTGDIEAITQALDITDQKKNRELIEQVTSRNCDFIAVVRVSDAMIEMRDLKAGLDFIPLNRSIDYAAGMRHVIEHFIVDDDRDEIRERSSLENLLPALEAGGECTLTYRRLEEDGGVARKQLDYSWLDDEHAEIVMVQTDVTVVYEQEQERLRRMQEALEAAQEASRAKSDFLARMSHDIRTPLNGVIGMTNLALQEESSPSVHDALEKIDRSGRFLLSLVNDILDMNRIESGRLELSPEPYTYREFMTYITSVFEPLCEEKGVHLEIDAQSELPDILVDRLRFNQVFFNLLSNAVKFTQPGGHVWFDVSLSGCDERGLHVCCSVCDDGIGIDPAFLEHLFEPFSQEHVGRSDDREGSGLGLAIVKRIVDVMGGRITVSSTLGSGTMFRVWFDLPLAVEEPEPERSGDVGADVLMGRRVLVAEDNEINSEIARRLLERAGMEVVLVTDGAQAVERFGGSDVGAIDVVLLDIRMPRMDGLEASRRIRALPRTDAATVPIVAMTANAYEEDIRECLDAGMDAHVSKPVEPGVLLATLRDLVAERGGGSR